MRGAEELVLFRGLKDSAYRLSKRLRQGSGDCEQYDSDAEVCDGAAAALVDPANALEIAEAMQRLEADEALRNRVVEAGLARAIIFLGYLNNQPMASIQRTHHSRSVDRTNRRGVMKPVAVVGGSCHCGRSGAATNSLSNWCRRATNDSRK